MSCFVFFVGYLYVSGSRLGKRELICLLLFTCTCNCVVSVGEVSSSSGCLGWVTLFFHGIPRPFHIIILST